MSTSSFILVLSLDRVKTPLNLDRVYRTEPCPDTHADAIDGGTRIYIGADEDEFVDVLDSHEDVLSAIETLAGAYIDVTTSDDGDYVEDDAVTAESAGNESHGEEGVSPDLFSTTSQSG